MVTTTRRCCKRTSAQVHKCSRFEKAKKYGCSLQGTKTVIGGAKVSHQVLDERVSGMHQGAWKCIGLEVDQ
eukprot:scaffold36453_cov18-Tisochrysis_lutea.AAC.1